VSAVTPVALNGTADTQTVATAKNGRYFGFSVRETESAAAKFRIREGSVTGRILDTVSLAADESAREFYPSGIHFQGGLFEDWISGAYEGTARVEAV
jgi:hypothetical protein